MAAVATTETVTVTINDVEIDVPKGELVVEAVKRLGLEIPVFCYHPRMKPVGMCRMCLVEIGFKQPDGSVRKMPKPQAGCTLPVDKNMVIYTDTEAIRQDRKGVLEFLLINHPLDCPICDRGGECPLQNNTLAYGPSTSRFIEMKRHLPKAYPLSDYVTLDLERCIQCGRCVRFTEEISGDHQLAFRFRGAAMQPSTFQLTQFESKFSGNVIEICPVGALTNSKYRFRARPWDIEARKGLCTLTPCGTNIWMDTRNGKVVRINGRTNEAVNEEWTADVTKFGHEFYNSPERIKACNLRDESGFKGIEWSEAYKVLIKAFSEKGEQAAILASPTLSNESLFLLQDVARIAIGTNNIDYRFDTVLPKRSERLEVKFGVDEVQDSLSSLENKKAILVFGAALADEQPMTFLRVRKAWFKNGARVATVGSKPTDTDSFADQIVVVEEGKLAQAAAKIASAAGVLTAKAKADDDAKKIAELLKLGNTAIVATYSLMQSEDGAKAAEILAAIAETTGATLHLLKNQANAEGASLLGVLPDQDPQGVAIAEPGLNTREILEACAKGKVKSLWLAGSDPIADFPDKDLAIRALENVDFLVVQAAIPNESTPYASLVLSLALGAEQEGTFTSSERRVQRMEHPLTPPGEAKSAFLVFAEFAARTKSNGVPMFLAADVRRRIAVEVPAFAGVNDAALAGEGVLLARNQTKGDWGPLATTLGSI